MRKRTLAMLLACTMMLSLVLTGCGGGKDGGGSGGSANGGGSGAAVTADGKDADGNVVDRSAYATSLGAQWFT